MFITLVFLIRFIFLALLFAIRTPFQLESRLCQTFCCYGAEMVFSANSFTLEALLPLLVKDPLQNIFTYLSDLIHSYAVYILVHTPSKDLNDIPLLDVLICLAMFRNFRC